MKGLETFLKTTNIHGTDLGDDLQVKEETWQSTSGNSCSSSSRVLRRATLRVTGTARPSHTASRQAAASIG